jgi:thioredoxin-related protein
MIFLAVPLMAAEVGDDGLHKQPWIRSTFKDLNEDLQEANDLGQRMVIMVEQRGCIYCTKMHEDVFSQAHVADYIAQNLFVIQINLHGDTEVIDFAGEALSEKQAARKWGLLFTPSILFLPEAVETGQTAQQAAVAIMPGAFGAGTTMDMFTWVKEKRYEIDSDEDFQRYHARRIRERNNGSTD